MMNQNIMTSSLDQKYGRALKDAKELLANESDISLINLMDYSKESEICKLEEAGILGKLVAIHSLKIKDNDLLPLLSSNKTGLVTMPLSGDEFSKYEREPIAIVGMSCRYPSCNDLEEFWDLLFHGNDGTSTPPPFRWRRDQCSRVKKDARETNAGFLKNPIDEFDAKFFGISPKEVQFMDPQHRLLHELVREALEDACIDPHALRGSSGSVFIGPWTNDYKDILTESGTIDFHRGYMGNSIGAAAARISFLLGMTGQSIATESGCSSAMVAVHLAARGLLLGETNLALACGVNMILHPFENTELPMVMSPDGHCKTFSEDADGFTRAEGGGVLVLKRLSDALKNGDNVWGLIRGSAVCQEGLTKSMGTPTVHCESLVMKEALADARVLPEEVDFVEAHGTGTALGDPMEVAAINKAYSTPNRKEPLIIGSVKTNVGHTESCSGITGIMKTVLAMHYGVIPAHLNFSRLNPAIDLSGIPAILPLERMEWNKVDGRSRIAGVSSFGITGTDAHVILEEPCTKETSKVLNMENMDRECYLLKVTAKTKEAMTVLLEKYHYFLQTSQEPISDICFSANTGRSDFPIRTAIVAKSRQEMCKIIQENKFLHAEANVDNPGKICFLFTGQGSLYPGMAKQLYDTCPVFRMHFEYCDKILEQNNINVTNGLWGNASKSANNCDFLYGMFCIQYALLKLWESWGVKPDFVLGHSVGEFAAAVCAGILSLEDAYKLVAERSRLIAKLPPGKMLAIRADKQQVDKIMKQFADGDERKILDYAAINSKEQVVVSGDKDVVLGLEKICTENNLKSIVLQTTHAFHSRHMDPIMPKYRTAANRTTKQTRQNCKYISGLTGELMDADDFDSQYWVDHTRGTVNFLKASKKAVELGCEVFIEIGPQPILSAFTMMNNGHASSNILCLPSITKKADDWSTILTSLAKLYVKGVHVDWRGLDQFQDRKKVRLPHYPFIGKKYWPEMKQVTGNSIHPLVGSIIPNASSVKLFQSSVNLNAQEWLKDHVIGQHVIFPGASYLEMCIAAGYAAVYDSTNTLGTPTRTMKVENLSITAPLALDESRTSQLQTVVEFNTNSDNIGNDWNDVKITIFSRVFGEAADNAEWSAHATATFSPLPTADEQAASVDQELFETTLETPGSDEIVHEVYDKLASLGLKFGTMFRSIEKIWKQETTNSILAKVRIPKEDSLYEQFIVHPIVLDAMIQSIMMLKLNRDVNNKKLCVPIRIGKFVWLSNLPTKESTSDIYIQATEVIGNGQTKVHGMSTTNCFAFLLDSTGRVLAVMSSIEMINTTARAVEAVLEQQKTPLPDLWEQIWRPKAGPLEHRVNLEYCGNAIKDMGQKYDDSNLKSYNERPDLVPIINHLDKLVYYNVLRGFYECGWKPKIGTRFTENDLFEAFKIQQQFRRQFGYFMGMLEAEGVLQSEQDGILQVSHMPPSPETVNKELICTSADLVEMFRSTLLVSRIGDNLGKILKGEQSVLSIMFPDHPDPNNDKPSELEFRKDFSNLVGTFGFVTEINTLWLKDYLLQATGDGNTRKIFRILELVAGAGTYTDILLKTFEAAGIEYEYTYTDVSNVFFPAAEQRFGMYLKNMKFKELNIEQDPLAQGFMPGYFDIVHACDVVHGAQKTMNAMENINALIKHNGLLAMGELTKPSRIHTFTLGLLQEFWNYEDLDLRPDHCYLSGDAWSNALQDTGFEPHRFACGNGHFTYFLCQKIGTRIPACIPGTPSRESNSKLWLLFHQDGNHISELLATKISQMGPDRQLVVINRGEGFESATRNTFLLRPDSENDFVQLMEAINKQTGLVEGIIYAWSLDDANVTEDHVLQPCFYLTKSLSHLKKVSSPKLVVLTSQTAPVEGSDVCNYKSASLWGFTNALRNENSNWNIKCIDVGAQRNSVDTNSLESPCEETEMLQVLMELWNPEPEKQIAYYGNTRYAATLTSHKLTNNDLRLPAGVGDRFKLILPETKSIADLKFGPLDPHHLGSGEVEVQIKASGLNFLDIFSVLKPSDAFKDVNVIGIDFSGVVIRVGSNVSKLSIGDCVYGANTVRSALPSHIKFHENDMLRLPDDWTFCEGATITTVACTALYCLMDIAKVTRSDTVLIHTASGGVGLAAIQICHDIGATIIATAGSKRKQNYLRSLGIQHIFHSRNTDYLKNILRVTKGRGVDVVLNSLTSESFKEATLSVCNEGARFVEMSKLTIWTAEEVAKLRPDVDYTVVDLSEIDSDTSRRLLSNLEDMVNKNVIVPIQYERFDALNIREALYYMQKARHIGKLVCVMPEVCKEHGRTRVHTPMFHANATYLITGGLGGIGFEVCKWLVKMGARHVLLAGRNPPNPSTREEISILNEQNNSRVRYLTLDVSSYDQCEIMIKSKVPEMGYPTLRGIMHAAGTLNDGLIEKQSWNALSSTFASKIDGTLNLHDLTKTNLKLEHFVLFSSMASLFGSPGQSNHAAGNYFVDTLAHHRHSIGLPATTVNWGQWGEVGIATESYMPGIKPFSTMQGISALEYALKSHRTQIGVLNIESVPMVTKFFPHLASYVDERIWKSVSSISKELTLTSNHFWHDYDSAEGVERKVSVLRENLRYILRNILKLDDADDVEDNRDFQEMGVDSLMFVEMRNILQSVLGERITIDLSALRDANTINLLAEQLHRQIEGDVDINNVPTLEEVQALIKEDCHLPDHIFARPCQAFIPTNKISRVLLTGSTGTLGPYVLLELSQRKQITEVFCLVRATKKMSGEKRLMKTLSKRDLKSNIDMNKVRVVEGNVALHQLGMQPIIWEELCRKVDAVFHCAANIQQTEHYKKRDSDTDVRSVNVNGIINVLDFASTGEKLKHVYSASSVLAVATTDENGHLSENWPEKNDFDGITTYAYPISKFIGDVLMKQAVLERGIPGKVFRFTGILGNSKTGRFVMEQNHVMLRYLFVLKHGMMPSNPIPTAFLPVDTCAYASVELFLNPDAPDDIYNILSATTEVDQGFVGVAEKLGYNVDIVEFSEFTEKIRQSDQDDSPFTIFKEFYKDDESIVASWSSAPALRRLLLEGGLERDFLVSRKVTKYLPEFYRSQGAVMDQIYKDLLFAKTQGWFDKYNL